MPFPSADIFPSEVIFPGTGESPPSTRQIVWDAPLDRRFETGLDRGVLYLKNQPGQTVVQTNRHPNPEATSSTWQESGITLGDSSAWGLGYTPSFGLGRYGYVQATYHAFSDSGEHDFESGLTWFGPLSDEEPGSDGPWNARYVGAGVPIKIGVTTSATKAGVPEKIEYRIHDGEGNWLTPILEVVSSTTGILWKELSGIVTPTVSGYIVVCHGVTATDWESGVDSYCDRELYLGDPGPYFDGSTTNSPPFSYEYSGTGIDRVSLKKTVVSAYPWNGLVGVDENGAESSTSYYVDGRPFLFMPKPKEYSATLRAYTYPDEFEAMIGIAEAEDAPGLLLDSQISDSFDLTYRTKVGNAVDGIDAGYKIHLVYNATVDPQGSSYVTLSEAVNPIEFSWNIQAVPTRVEGYRATAHLTIDTRRMDSDKLQMLEGMLYGTDDEIAYMPSAQTVFDILAFGDTIVITDNGDGTWDAEGASWHFSFDPLDDGIFTLYDVNATDNGDGTFTFTDGGNTIVTEA